MAEQVPYRYLVEGLAELFQTDESEVVQILVRNGVGSWRQFVSFLALQRLEDRKVWEVD